MRKRIAHGVVKHSSQILKLEPYSAPWTWVFICGLATLIPMLVGLAQGDVAHSIYGGLCGYLVSLGDHKGSLRNRLTIVSLGFGANLILFSVGVFLHHQFILFMFFTSWAVYMLGLLGGLGAELERMLLLSIVQLLVARYAASMTPALLPSLYPYFAFAYATIVIGIVVSHFTFQKASDGFKTVRASASEFLTRDPNRHLYALSYATAIIFALIAIEVFSIPRGYWTAVTILLITKPDRKESLYRIAQRMIGTLLGVLNGEWILSLTPSQLTMVFIASGCAALVPFVWSRNYWLVSFLATNLVLMLLSIALYGSNEPITHLRLLATFYGCAISLITIALFSGTRFFLQKRRAN